MDFTFQTPALLFPTVSLLMLAYTNRFLGITSVIRKLHKDLQQDDVHHDFYMAQIQSLSDRLRYIVFAQKFGLLSLLFCTLSILLLFLTYKNLSHVAFFVALCLMCVSLMSIFKELTLSLKAMSFILNDCHRIDRHRHPLGF